MSSQAVVPDRNVPYIDLARQHAPLRRELLEAIGDVIDHGNFILGEEVARLERQFADLCGARFALGVNSGTDALILALKAISAGPGDEVITVPNSFVATTSAICLAGAKPVFVDVSDDYNMNPALLEQAITSRTKAILPVHLTGRPADMDPILEIARRRGLAVVEDCAQAVLAEYKGRRVGSLGTVGCFSLHPLKTLNACGDGGMITTNDAALYEQLRLRRNIGLRTRDDCVLWSHNSRLDSIQAAIVLVKLRYLEGWTAQRRAHAQLYRTRLAGLPAVRMQPPADWERSVYHTFVVQAERRDELRAFLASRGIGTAVHYPVPIHLTRIGRELGYAEGSFPKAERQAKTTLSLPVYPELCPADLDYIAGQIHAFYSEFPGPHTAPRTRASRN